MFVAYTWIVHFWGLEGLTRTMRHRWPIYFVVLGLLVGCAPRADVLQITPTATAAVPTPTRKPTPTPVAGVSPTARLRSGVRQGDPAPDLVLTALNGETVSLSQFRGQPVLINFWAVWCTFCRFEMPDIQKAYDEYQDEGLVVLGINVGEDEQTVASFVRELDITFPVLFDRDGRVWHSWRMRGLPTTVFVDSEGVVRIIHVGMIEYQDIVDYVEQIGVSL